MSDEPKQPVVQPVVQVPGLQPVPYVVVKLLDGTLALRHPSELQKLPNAAPVGEAGQ